MEKDPKTKKFVPSDYHDDSRPSLTVINFGLWFTENRRRIIKFLLLLLIFSTIGFFVYSGYGYIYYFFVGRNQDQSLTDNFEQMGVNLQAARLRSVVIPLEVSLPLSFANGEKVDLAVNIKNSNEKYFVSFDYCFLASGQEFVCGNDFLLPNTEKFVLSLANNRQVGNYEFVLKKVSWKKIDNHIYPDWPAFYNERISFVISDVNFQSSPDGLNNTLFFTVENKSPFSYWELPLNIILKNGNSPVGVNRFVLSNFKSLEKRTVSLSWAERLSVTKPLIVPDLNILNDAVYHLE